MMKEFEFVVAEEYKFLKGEKKNSNSEKLRNIKALLQGTYIDNSAIKNLSTSIVFSMPILIKEKKALFLVKYEFEYREDLKFKSFFWKFCTNGILKQETNTMTF